jgi:hypothetical protein
VNSYGGVEVLLHVVLPRHWGMIGGESYGLFPVSVCPRADLDLPGIEPL